MRSKNANGFGAGRAARMGTPGGVAVAFAFGVVVAASGCDHIHWLGILDAGGGSTEGGLPPPKDAAPDTVPDGGWFEAGSDGHVSPDVGAGDGGSSAGGCPGACAAIMGCGLGGYGPYRAGVGYAYAYVIGPYAYASGYASPGGAGYGAYGFRDLEYQQCVVTCETYSDCLGCGPASERDDIVNCVLANTCPGLLDCLAR